MCEPSSRSYIRKSLVPIEEDEYNEFKGHRSIAIEELPPWCFHKGSDRRSRKPASRAIAAFINSGRGGTVYLGIIDEGVVKGLYLTEYQKDHVLLSLKDLFSRYEPPVPEDAYEVEFVPIFTSQEERMNRPAHKKEEVNKSNVEMYLKGHLLRTYDFCWCDKDLARRIDEDCDVHDYVVEIKIYPQEPRFNVDAKDGSSFHAVIPIVYQNEEGKCFFRKSASCVEYSIDSVKELALQQLQDLYYPVITSLRREIQAVMDRKS